MPRFCASVLAFLTLGVAAPASAKLLRPIVVVSDMHFGASPPTQGSFHAFEDFRWQADLTRFLAALSALAPAGLDLVLNGDTFELWQGDDGLCPVRANADLGCTEAEAEQRMEAIVVRHATSLALIEGFAARGNNVFVVPGNHDAGLLLPRVERKLRVAWPNPRVRVVREGVWRSDDSSVHAEHGHMLPHDPNRLSGWPEPFITEGGVRHLRRSWGEQFVVRFYNTWEIKYPIVDNVGGVLGGAGLAVAAEGATATLKTTAGFLRFALLGVSWPQFRGGLGDDRSETSTPPVWDLPRLRREGAPGLARLLAPGDPMRPLLASASLGPGLAGFDDEDLALFCDRAQLRAQAEGSARPVCPSNPLGQIADALLQRRRAQLARHLRAAVAGRPAAARFRTFIYSHSHAAEPPDPVPVDDDWTPIVVNSGAWQRTVTIAQLGQAFPGNNQDSARRALGLSLERLPACYPMVLLSPGASESPRLLRWRPLPGPHGTIDGGSCTDLPIVP